MIESTGIIKSIFNQFKQKLKQSEPSDIRYESIIKHLLPKEHLLNEPTYGLWCPGDSPPVRNYNEPSSLMDRKHALSEQVFIWSTLDHDLTESQKKLNKELLNALECLASNCNPFDDNGEILFDNHQPLEEFLHDNKNNKDLKVILNLRRGESGSTVLHTVAGAKISEFICPGNQAIDLLLEAGADPNIQNNKGKTPLHLAVATGHEFSVHSLLLKNADPNIRDKKGKTPQQIAVNNHRYDIEELFLTDKQKELKRELYNLDIGDSNYAKNLKEFLSKYEGDLDLKVVLNIRNANGKSQLFSHLNDYWENDDVIEEAKEIFLKVGALDYGINLQQKKKQSSTLLVNLTLNQREKLNKFFGKVFQAQNIAELEEVVSDAIKSGVRLNYSFQDSSSGNEYAFTDYVIKRISELEKNPKVASSIICKLVSKGAVFGNTVDADIIDKLTSEFEEHKANMKKAYRDYIVNAHKFIEIAKSATNSELKDIRIDNPIFYLEYSKESIIDIIKVLDGARDLGLTDGNIEYGKNIVKISNSEVEIITQKGIRNYTDLAEGSDVVLTFYTSLGELKVRLYPDEDNKELIRVEVSDEDLDLLDKIESCDEEIGQNCLLGGLSVIDAIDQGVFSRSGGLMRHEVISDSSKKTVSWAAREELRKISDSKGEIAR